MSSVRMSEKLRSKITAKGRSIFEGSIMRLENALAIDFHDRIAKEYISSELAIIAGIPEAWTTNITHVTYKIYYDQDLLGHNQTQYSFMQKALTAVPDIPKFYNIYEEAFGGVKILTIPNTFTFSNTLSQELSKWRKGVRDTQTEQTAFMSELKRILKRCNTLKQFLDTWPQGENIVPPEILAKLNEKPVREKKEPLLTEEASVALSTTLLKRTLMS